MPPEEARMTVEDAHRVLRADYWSDVRGLAQDLKDRLERGEFTDRDDFVEALDQDVDGHQRVIYTGQAIESLLYSDNDSAYAEDFGAEGMLEGDSVAWSRLAYAAFRADVVEHLDAIDVDVNDPIPEPDEDDDN